MIRIRPIGMALAILFLVFGPHGRFFGSSGTAPAQQATPVSTVLPDASQVAEQPRHSFVDAVQTKEGWKVRVASERQIILYLVTGAIILAFAWPLRQMAKSRKDSGSTEDADI